MRSDLAPTAFYEQLLDFERSMLARMEHLVADQPAQWRTAVVRTDIEPLRSLISELEDRLRFWRSQAAAGS